MSAQLSDSDLDLLAKDIFVVALWAIRMGLKKPEQIREIKSVLANRLAEKGVELQ